MSMTAILGEALGAALISLLLPVVLLILYKAIPKYRGTDPTNRYISAAVIAAIPLFLSSFGGTSAIVLVLAALMIAAILGVGYFRDKKTYLSGKQQSEGSNQ